LSRIEGPQCKTRGINRFGNIFQLKLHGPGARAVDRGLGRSIVDLAMAGEVSSLELTLPGSSGYGGSPAVGKMEEGVVGNLTTASDGGGAMRKRTTTSSMGGDFLSTMGRGYGHREVKLERGKSAVWHEGALGCLL
jgi:hypothetical protein